MTPHEFRGAVRRELALQGAPTKLRPAERETTEHYLASGASPVECACVILDDREVAQNSTDEASRRSAARAQSVFEQLGGAGPLHPERSDH